LATLLATQTGAVQSLEGDAMRFVLWRLSAVVLASSPLLTGIAAAHHSTAEFDYTKQLTIQGKVKEVQWTNPHAYIQLLVPGDDGTQVEWSVEIGSPSLNVNMGWRKNSVVAGD